MIANKTMMPDFLSQRHHKIEQSEKLFLAGRLGGRDAMEKSEATLQFDNTLNALRTLLQESAG